MDDKILSLLVNWLNNTEPQARADVSSNFQAAMDRAVIPKGVMVSDHVRVLHGRSEGNSQDKRARAKSSMLRFHPQFA